MAKKALDRLQYAIGERFQEPEDNVLLAILLDPRTACTPERLLRRKNEDGKHDMSLLRKAEKLLKRVVEDTLHAKIRYERKKRSQAEAAGEASTETEDAEDSIPNDEEDNDELPQFILDRIVSPRSAARNHARCEEKLREDINRQVPALIDAFRLSVRNTFNPITCLAKGSSHEDLFAKSFTALMRHTDIKVWARTIKLDQPVFYHLMQMYLGTVEASSFVETLFSTAGRVWDDSNVRLNASTFECITVLRKGRALAEQYNRQYRTEKA